MLKSYHDIYNPVTRKKLADYLSHFIHNPEKTQELALPDNTGYEDLLSIVLDRSVAQDIVRVLQGNEMDYKHPGNQLVGSALGQFVLDRFDFEPPVLESLRKFLDQTWTVSGFAAFFGAAMQEPAHEQTILSFFRAVVAECNTSPEKGFYSSDQEAVGSLVQVWEETGDTQELFSGPSAWSWYPYEHVLLSALSLLVPTAPTCFADILDDIRFPWALDHVLAGMPDQSKGNTLPALLAHVKSCLDDCSDSEQCAPSWNKKVAAPLILQAVTTYAQQAISQDEYGGVPEHIQRFFREIATILAQRKDGVALSFHFCCHAIPWLDNRSRQGKISPSSLASETFCEALRSCLETFDLMSHFFRYGIGMADPGLDKSELQDFAETGILKRSTRKYSLAALAATAFMLPSDCLGRDRARQIVTRYEQNLAAGHGFFPVLSAEAPLPLPTHEAIAKAYLQMESPYKVWQDTAKHLDAAINRVFRLPFTESSLDIRNMELFHLCTGLAIYDHMDEDTEQHDILFLKNMLEVLKTRLLTDIDIKLYSTQLRYIASNIAARMFFHYLDEDSEINKLKSAQELLEYMISISEAALDIMEILLLNGLDFGDIKNDKGLHDVALNIYNENSEILKYNTKNNIPYLCENIERRIAMLS